MTFNFDLSVLKWKAGGKYFLGCGLMGGARTGWTDRRTDGRTTPGFFSTRTPHFRAIRWKITHFCGRQCVTLRIL